METFNYKTIHWGPDEAKGDEYLSDYFVEFPDFEGIKTGNYRYVIGRKGTGKTAVIEKIKMEIDELPLQFFSELSLRDFPIQDLREMRDRSYRDKSQFTPSWLLLVYIELAKLIIEDNGAGPVEAVTEIRNFLIMNNLQNCIGLADTVTLLKKNESKFKIDAKWIGSELSKSSSTQSEIVVHYNKIVTPLAKLLTQIKSESTFWLFIDELDEGFRAGDSGLRLILLALLRAVEDSALALKSATFSYRPVLVLRSDIFDRLDDNDLNKLDDYTIRLKWYSHEDNSEFALKRIPNKRILTSLKPVIQGDPWASVVNDFDPNLPSSVGSIWKYMSNRTYERPRDIIKFCKFCSKHSENGILTFAAVSVAESQYSDWLYRELSNEIHSYLPCWREALQCITQIGSGKLGLNDYIAELKSNRVVSVWASEQGHDFEEVVETLFNFGIFGNFTHGNWLFKYKDSDLAWNPKLDLIVHWGLKKKLRLFRNGI